MIKQNLSGVTLIDKKGVRVNPNIHLGESDGYISGDILDANAVQGTVNEAVQIAKEDLEDQITDLIGSAPEVLDTLAELADAIGDDPDFFNNIHDELDQKVDKVSGKGLSTNDYTTEEKNKLAGIQAGAQVNPTNVSAFTNDAGYITQHQDISSKEDVTTIVPVTTAVSTLTTEAGKYYRIDAPMETLAVTLPAMDAVTSVKKVGIYFTAGTTPDVTITADDNKRIVFQDGYEIEAGKTYKVDALFNGSAWIVTAVEIFVPETKLVVYYDIQDISNPTTIFTNYDNSVKSIDVDGKETISEFSQGSVTYQFDNVGEHVIKYEFNNPTTVGNSAPLFSSATPIKRAVIADTFTSIGDRAFWYCAGLTSITIPDSVTSIGGYTFGNCTGLTSITIPDSVTSIGESAFSGCRNLTSVTIGSGVTSIGGYTFYKCSGLTSITIPDSVTSIGSTAFRECSGLTSITIPDSVISIGTMAFNYCSGLTSITIPDSVTSIGGSAFEGCTGFTNITIPDSVTSIGGSAFRDCSGLTSIVVDSANTVYDSRNNCNAIINTSTNELIAGCKNTVIPNTVTSIGSAVFSNCTGLTSVIIPDGVTSIGDYAFNHCSGLTSIDIPSGVTSIGQSAFSYCSGLTSIDIPSGVTSIGQYAFEKCSGLTSITIPDGVTSIGNGTFSSCSGLTSITIGSGVTSIGTSAFYNCKGLTSITSLATTAPTIKSYTFDGVKTGGTLTVPSGSTGYDVWMGTGYAYLGFYNWTKVEQ